MKFKLALLRDSDKLAEGIEYAHNTLYPFIEQNLQMMRDQGLSGSSLVYWYFNYSEISYCTLNMYRSANEIDAGLEFLSQVKARLTAARKAGELTPQIETETLLKETLPELRNIEIYFDNQSAKRTNAAVKSLGKKVAIGLLVVSAIAVVTYGVMSTRNRFRR